MMDELCTYIWMSSVEVDELGIIISIRTRPLQVQLSVTKYCKYPDESVAVMDELTESAKDE
jgi:hypothetical protein